MQPLTVAELNSDTEKKKREIFDACIEKRWGTAAYPSAPPVTPFVPYEDDEETPHEIPEMDDPVDPTGNAVDQQPLYDKMIHAEVVMPQGDQL